MRLLPLLLSSAVVCLLLSACGSDGPVVIQAGAGAGGAVGSAGASGAGSGSSGASAAAGGNAPGATFTQVKAIFQASCGTGNCHLNGKVEGKLKLDGAVAYANLVGVRATIAPEKTRVVAGDPTASFLVTKIDGDVASDGSEGSAMPLIIGQLQADQIALVKSWIAAGAMDD